jgi:hypothetical protein
MAVKTPTGLGAGGRSLWREVTEAHDLDAAQRVQLLEACRAKDRLDKLDALLRGEVDAWVDLETDRDDTTRVVVDGALSAANATANLLKQLLAALRLPDGATGKKPQARGGARGAYQPKGAGSVSSLDRARQRSGA